MNRPVLVFLIAALVAATGFAQDECAGAIALTVGTNPTPAASGNTFTITGATLSAGWPTPTCDTSASADVWFSFIPGTSGLYQFDQETPGGFAAGTLTTSIFDLFPDTLCVPGPAIACDDDGGVVVASGGLLIANLTAGLVYYLRVSEDDAPNGGGTFYVNVTSLGPPLANDECSGAIAVADGINPMPPLGVSGTTYTNVLATTSVGSPLPTCGSVPHNDVWFVYSAVTAGLYTFSTDTPAGFTLGTHTDTILDVLDGTTCPPTVALGCDDDSGVSPGFSSTLTVGLPAAGIYYVRVSTWSGAADGSFYLSISSIPAPTNDDCSAAIPLALGTNPTPAASGNYYTLTGAILSPGWAAPTCDVTANSGDVWFSFTPATSGVYQFDQETPAGFTAGTMIASVFDVFPDTLCTPTSAIACDDDGGVIVGSGGLVTANLTAGSIYYLRVTDDDAYSGGTFYVNVTYLGAALANDECAGAIPVSVGTNPAPAASGNFYSMTNATLSLGWAASCDTTTGGDVWFTFTPATTGVYQFDQQTPAGYTAGTLTETVIDVFPDTLCVGPSAYVACDDDSGTSPANGGLVLALLTGGLPYYVRVSEDDAPNGGGTFYLNVTFLGAPATNDDCATATPISLGTGFYNNISATLSAGWPALSTCPTAVAAINLDVWFSFVPAVSDVYQFETTTACGMPAGSMTNTTIALYDGSVGTCGTPFAHMVCDGDSSVGSLSWLKASLTAGTTYYLRVGPTATTGAANVNAFFYLTATQGDIVNDTCATALPLSLGTNPAPAASCFVYSNVGATDTAGYPAVCGGIFKDLWFSFTPASTGNYIIDTNTPCGFAPGSALNTTIAVYTGCAAAPASWCDADSGQGTLSAVNVPMTMGIPYLIRIGVTAATGEGTFYVNVNQGLAVAANDECTGAIPVVLGTNPSPATTCVTFNNYFATTSAGTVCATIANDVWFVFTPPHSGDYIIDTETPSGFIDGSMTNSTVAVYGGSCLTPILLGCDADSGSTNGGLNSIATASLTGGVPHYIRVGSTSATTEGTFYLTITEDFALYFTSNPCGPGVVDISATIIKGPASAGYFMCVTTNAGAFPSGWFYGIDPFFSDVLAQASAPGFTGVLSPAGGVTIGPICGLPPGIFSFYGVALVFATPVIDIPIGNTAPVFISP